MKTQEISAIKIVLGIKVLMMFLFFAFMTLAG
jgi:hypothetical protein